MKRRELERHLQSHGCAFLREGSAHSIWQILKPATKKPFRATMKSNATWRGKFAGACPLKFLKAHKIGHESAGIIFSNSRKIEHRTFQNASGIGSAGRQSAQLAVAD